MALAPRGRLPVTEVGHAAAPQLKKREEAKSKVAVVGAGRRGEEVTRARARKGPDTGLREKHGVAKPNVPGPTSARDGLEYQINSGQCDDENTFMFRDVVLARKSCPPL